ncbi:uncharacterized protein LOC133886936 [Phragmites australis]|uniref:uncharacterized protein LOC133886936 n=1 Tax=Phragmites australis TaxID=29695 RepID=UPI002D79883E|nr:uncharacterized protein LOC133886936 [Phragmites australis]
MPPLLVSSPPVAANTEHSGLRGGGGGARSLVAAGPGKQAGPQPAGTCGVPAPVVGPLDQPSRRGSVVRGFGCELWAGPHYEGARRTSTATTGSTSHAIGRQVATSYSRAGRL